MPSPPAAAAGLSPQRHCRPPSDGGPNRRPARTGRRSLGRLRLGGHESAGAGWLGSKPQTAAAAWGRGPRSRVVCRLGPTFAGANWAAAGGFRRDPAAGFVRTYAAVLSSSFAFTYCACRWACASQGKAQTSNDAPRARSSNKTPARPVRAGSFKAPTQGARRLLRGTRIIGSRAEGSARDQKPSGGRWRRGPGHFFRQLRQKCRRSGSPSQSRRCALPRNRLPRQRTAWGVAPFIRPESALRSRGLTPTAFIASAPLIHSSTQLDTGTGRDRPGPATLLAGSDRPLPSESAAGPGALPAVHAAVDRC